MKNRRDTERTEENRLEDKERTNDKEVKKEVAKANHRAYKEFIRDKGRIK